MILQRVISGGQTGVDQAALRAARACGITTGGFAPRGWKTLAGPAPWLRDFGLLTHGSYRDRTYENVRSADTTLRIAANFDSLGEICTANAIRQYGRSYLDVALQSVIEPREVAGFIYRTQTRILNVAGNSETTMPGIGPWAEAYLCQIFAELKRL